MSAFSTSLCREGLVAFGDSVAERAADLDMGVADTRADIASAGAAGLLHHGIDGGDLSTMVEIIESTSIASLSVGFSLWAQRMTAEYVARAPQSLRDTHLDSLLSGSRIGVTAMAAGLKQVAGLGQVATTSRHVDDGVLVDGPIHWASNVFADSLIVLPVRDEHGRSSVVVVRSDAPGVRINPEPALMALGSTASTSLELNGVAVAAADVVTDDLAGFVGAIRPIFLLLQSAFCSGAASATIDGCRRKLTGINHVFADETSALESDRDSVRNRLYRFAQAPDSVTPADLLRLRLDAGRLAVTGARLEATLCGGAGYASGTAVNRRFREIAFLPIQSPSEGQLRWELAQFE